MSTKQSELNSRKIDSRFQSESVDSRCCFICDNDVGDNGIQIILGRTPYSNVGLPTKIGQLIGDDFMVVIGVSDIMCSHCASLISQLDKLETDACVVKKTLLGYIATKYQLNHNDICAKRDQTEKALNLQEESVQNTVKRTPPEKLRRLSRKKSQLVSLLASNNRLSKAKGMNCGNCNFSTTDADTFQVHAALCLKQVNQCSQCGVLINSLADNKFNEVYSYASACKVCNSSFHLEQLYSKHMESHIVDCTKCGLCNFSSEKNSMLSHVFSHGMQIFQCSLCQQVFHLKSELNDHMSSHLVGERCLKCSMEQSSEARHLTEGETSFPFVNDLFGNSETEISSKGKAMSDYVESLIRGDGFENDGSNIEFHSCPSCGLTFLNKLLFTEHMKMHTEDTNQVSINDAHEEVLKTAAENITGDCSIDDDLEDLFEKLHAETTSASLIASQEILEKRDCSQNEAVHSNRETLDVNFVKPLQDEVISFCASVSSEVGNEINTVVPEEANLNDQAANGIEQVTTTDKITPIEFSTFDSSGHGTEVMGCSQDLKSGEMDPMQSQTFIFITNNLEDLSDCVHQAGMVLDSTPVGSDDGNTPLLPYILNDAPPPAQFQSSAIDEDAINAQETTYFQHDINKSKIGIGENDNKVDEISTVGSDSLSCSYCGFQTSIPLVLKKHIKIHEGGSVLQCSLCYSVFLSIQRLLSHIDVCHKTHAVDGPIICPLCMVEIAGSKQLRTHVHENHASMKQNYPCHYCSKDFTTRKACANHEESHVEIFKVQCLLCPKKFASEDDRDDHVEWDHAKLGQCRYCGKKIDKLKALKNHELRHMQESNHHECPDCKRVFKTKTGYRHHLATHTGQFKYCCDFCGRGFMSRMMLEEHRSCHTKEERYICDICGQKFSFQSTYWIHRKWHETPYPYKCNFCGRLFRHSSLLAVHKRKHTGERPYKCPHCPLTFPVSGTLKRHIILHTGIYPFNCSTCKRGFTARHKFALHMQKVHSIDDLVVSKSDQGRQTPVVEDTLPGDVKEWIPCNIDLTEGGNLHTMSLSETQAINRDPLISDQCNSSRVVKVVLDDAYQPVATVTLGACEPDDWCE